MDARPSISSDGEVIKERVRRKVKISKEVVPVIMLTLVTIRDKINELYDTIMDGKKFEESVNRDENMRPMPVFFMYDQTGNESAKIRNKRFSPIVPIMEYTMSNVATMLTVGLISKTIGNNTEEANERDGKKNQKELH